MRHTKEAMYLADDVACRFNEYELDQFRSLYAAAEKWAEELEGEIIPAINGEEERDSRIRELDEVRIALQLFSRLAEAHDDADTDEITYSTRK